MDCSPVLETIAHLLPDTSNVEDQLVTFDCLVGVSEPEHRADAARMLHEAASCAAITRGANRLEKLREDVDACQDWLDAESARRSTQLPRRIISR